MTPHLDDGRISSVARPRCFLALGGSARDEAVAEVLYLNGLDVIKGSDIVHVVGHFDLAVVSDELPQGIWADVLVRLLPEGTATVHTRLHDGPELEVSVDSMEELMTVLSGLASRDRRSEPI